jgi:hypothetical protein
MQSFALLISLVAALRADTQQGAKVNPVEKVTELLEKLQAEIEGEGKSEAEAYDKFACFCKEQADNKQYAIEKFTVKDSELDAEIDAKTTKKAKLDQDIVDHQSEIDSLTQDQQDAQDTRDSEHDTYMGETTDLAQAISNMERAIDSISATKGEMTDSHALISTVVRDSVALAKSIGSRRDLTSLIQADPHGYSFHANEIISTLKGLNKDFKEKKVEVDQDEQETLQTFEMTSGARRNQIKAEEHSKSQKAELSAQLESELNAAKTDLQQTQEAQAADQAFLNDLTQQCETKARDWDQRSSTRNAELVAIAGALEQLKGDVSKMYSANDLGLAQKKATPSKRPAPVEEIQTEADADSYEEEMDSDVPVTFLQLRRPNFQAERKQVVGFIAKKAAELKSPVLSTLLLKIRDAPSPFAKVKQMITDLVNRLEDESAAEAGQKQWCDDNLAETNSERDEAQTNVESLNALHTEKSALSAQLTSEINELSDEIKQLYKELNEASELRDAEKAENQETLERAEAGRASVANAIDILNGFYNPSFIQLKKQPAAEGYERFKAAGAGSDGKTVGDMAPDAGGVSGDYGGKSDASKSIITLMEQIREDFENTKTATASEEAAAEGEFQSFKTESENSISTKDGLVDTKTDERTQAKLDIEQAEADLKRENGLLQAALDELEKLKPVCVDSGMSWEERSARRNQEIDALKEALKILQNTDFGF